MALRISAAARIAEKGMSDLGEGMGVTPIHPFSLRCSSTDDEVSPSCWMRNSAMAYPRATATSGKWAIPEPAVVRDEGTLPSPRLDSGLVPALDPPLAAIPDNFITLLSEQQPELDVCAVVSFAPALARTLCAFQASLVMLYIIEQIGISAGPPPNHLGTCRLGGPAYGRNLHLNNFMHPLPKGIKIKEENFQSIAR